MEKDSGKTITEVRVNDVIKEGGEFKCKTRDVELSSR